MEIPELPKGYFFRLVEGHRYIDGWSGDITEINAQVQIRKKTWFGFSSDKALGVNIPNTHSIHVSKQQAHETMLAAVKIWEQRKTNNAAYGDYPPNRL